MTQLIGLERTIAVTERLLSTISIVPVVGIVSGAIKVILGVIQVIGGLLALMGSIPFLLLNKEQGKKIAYRAGSHVVNGLANIVAGAFEAIPFVGTAIGIKRLLRQNGSASMECVAETGQEGMIFVGYRILHDNPSIYRTQSGEYTPAEAAQSNLTHATFPFGSMPMYISG